MSLAAELWRENSDLATQALDTPFVRGVADGSLALPKFQAYVAQDAFFLDAFARAYALALAAAEGSNSLRDFSRLIAAVVDELGLHHGYAEKWDVDLEGVTPHPATRSYTDFLLATAVRADTGITCGAMTPCMRLYAHVGQTLASDGVIEANPYNEWITTYNSPGFDEQAQTLERLLDRHGDDAPEMHNAYRRAMQLEVDFFRAFG